MTSTIKVNNIQNQCGANIINESSNTITIGASGDTVTLASGASQTGFGRTGTVDWDTTAKTASFTAVSGNGYFVNTTSGAITVTLPASPSAGDIVAVADYAGTAATNNITIARNGSNFEGGTDNGSISTNRQTATLVYVDGTQGWVPVNSNDASFVLPAFIAATGGTVTTCGNFKIHTFTGPGTFCVSAVGNPAGSATVDYLVVAGGGGTGSGQWVGGGGAGGFRESSGEASGCYSRSSLGACVSALPVSVQGYPITVGGGGAGGDPAPGTVGANSVFSTITSTGGGFSGTYNQTGSAPTGGSGAGGTANTQTGGAGNTPPVSPPQGNPGGSGSPSGGGGGGGATAAGTSKTAPDPGPSAMPGGAGAPTSITASSVTYAAGGRGGGDAGLPSPANGTTNRGDGGSRNASTPGAGTAGGSGGSGIVVIRYKYQ